MKYDLAVIGVGPGGQAAAIRAKQLGMSVVAVEKRETLGGTCLNVGCIPSKTLLDSSHAYAYLMTKGLELGVKANLSFDFSKMMQRKEEVVKGLTSSVSAEFKNLKIDVKYGTATLLDAHTFQVGDEKIEAENILLATGSEPIALPFLPFDEKTVLSSTGALALGSVPKTLTVVGAGVIGVELASVYARLGTEVTLVEMLDRICGNLDQTLHAHFLQSLKNQGLKFHLKSKVLEAKKSSGITLKVQTEKEALEITSEKVLVAVGRKPYSQGLGLEKVGVATTERGHVVVDGFFRTNQKNIYAIGDLIDGPMLAHKASQEGIAVVEHLAGKRQDVDYMAIANIIYTHPELASVGLTEQEVKAAGIAYTAGSYPYRALARARCKGETEGLFKLIGDKISGRLLGAHIFGEQASELIAELALAISKRVTLQELGNLPNGHPTFGEGIREAARRTLS